MSKMDDLVDDLAVKALDLEEETGDEYAVKKVADAIGSSSPTMEEAFLTAIRIRRADRRARQMIDSLKGKGEAPKLPARPVGDDDGH